MHLTVFAAFLGCDKYYAVGAARAINGRCRAVFKHIERGDVLGVHVLKAATWNAVDYDERAKTGLTRIDTAYLYARCHIRIGSTGVNNRNTRHFTFDKRSRV